MKRTHDSLATRPLLPPGLKIRNEDPVAHTEAILTALEKVRYGLAAPHRSIDSDELDKTVRGLLPDTLEMTSGYLSTASVALSRYTQVIDLRLGEDVAFEDVESFAAALAKNTTLQTLHIEHCDRFDFGASLKELAKGIGDNDGLKTLALAYSNDDPDLQAKEAEGLAALGACLVEHKSLECLHIDFEHMSAEQVTALCNEIAGNRKLTRLSLWSAEVDALVPIMLAMVHRGALPQLEELTLGSSTAMRTDAATARESAALSLLLSQHKALHTVKLHPVFLAPEHVDILADGLALSPSVRFLEPMPVERSWLIPQRIWTSLQRNRGHEARLGTDALTATCPEFLSSWGAAMGKTASDRAMEQVTERLAPALTQGIDVQASHRQTASMSSINRRTNAARAAAAMPALVQLLTAWPAITPPTRSSETR